MPKRDSSETFLYELRQNTFFRQLICDCGACTN